MLGRRQACALLGVGAPKNTPKEIIAKLYTEINAILAEPDMTKRLVELGGAPLIQTPEKFGADIAAETEKWKKVIDGANVEKVHSRPELLEPAAWSPQGWRGLRSAAVLGFVMCPEDGVVP